MSLYYEAAEVLNAPTNAGGSLKSRIFSNTSLKSQPAQIYALVIETCKWSFILKEVIERTTLLSLERKLTPILSLLLVHDLLLAKRGIALPATHGLRAGVERHKARLQAEFTKARIRRSIGSMEALKAYVDAGEEGSSNSELPYPRWIRVNTLRTQLEDQLETTFVDYERVASIKEVRHRGSRRIYIDVHVPNLVAVSPSIDLTKTEAYKSGAIIFQDKASCFPAYMLDPLPEDGDIVDTCAAPGNKTTHIASILLSHATAPEDLKQTIHAFEKNKLRAETLTKMLGLADAQKYTKIHAGQDFLKVDPNDPIYKSVGALLLDPSCSGSGIVGRDDVPELHLPSLHPANPETNGKAKAKGKVKAPKPEKESLKRKRGPELDEALDIIDDDGVLEPVSSEAELQKRLDALSTFQLSLLEHAMAFPAARKITYSTCSIHGTENENVVIKALESDVAKQFGWRILRREEQIRGMREWPIRGEMGGDLVKEACVRAIKGDDEGTMGFFLAGFVKNDASGVEGDAISEPTELARDERGFIVRDLMGFPVLNVSESNETADMPNGIMNYEEWNGFSDNDQGMEEVGSAAEMPPPRRSQGRDNPEKDSSVGTDQESSLKKPRKRKKGKGSSS